MAAVAPRPCLLAAPLHDSNFKWESVDKVAKAAQPIYELFPGQFFIEESSFPIEESSFSIEDPSFPIEEPSFLYKIDRWWRCVAGGASGL